MTPNEWADFWHNVVGVNVFPANTKSKEPFYTDKLGNKHYISWSKSGYQTNSITEEKFKEWKDNNCFDNGLAVICGKVFRGKNEGLWINGLDLDNPKAIEVLLKTHTLKQLAETTLVEAHSDQTAHVYYLTREAIKGKVGNPKERDGNPMPQIEVKSGGNSILYCAGGLHKDGKLIEILGTNEIKIVEKEKLEKQIDGICKEFGIPYLDGVNESQKPIEDLVKDDFELHEGNNRSLAVLRYLDSKKKYNPEFTEIELYGIGLAFNQKHCKPPYDNKKIKDLAKQALNFIETQNKKDELENPKKKKKVGDEPTIQIYKVGKQKIIKAVKSETDTEQIVIQALVYGKPQWIDVLSPTFTQIVRLGTQEKYKKIYGDSTYTTAIKNIHAEGLLNGTDIRPVFKRSALIENILYYDLQNLDGTIYKISKDEIIECQDRDDIPIFLKSPSGNTISNSQPKPMFDNSKALDELVKLFRIKDEDKLVFKSHLICYFLMGFPIPIAIFHGEQGSAKTSTTSGIKQVYDPEGECALSIPEKVDDLAVVLSNHGMSSFDNTDNFTKDISQFLCKAVTGTQHVKRQLFSNGEEFSLMLKSKIILNGISPSINQPDLLERSIFYELPPIDKTERMTDKKFQEKLTELKPQVLGVIFETLQKAMKIYDDIDKELDGKSLPRMASFSVWGESISRVLGHGDNSFIDSYTEKLEASDIGLTDEYPIIQPLIDFMGDSKVQELLLSNLFERIVDIDKIKDDDRLPKDTIRLGKQLRQLSPALRTLGYNVTILTYNKKDGKYPRGQRIVKITKISENGLDNHIEDDNE